MKKLIMLIIILCISSCDTVEPRIYNNIDYKLQYFCAFGGEPFPTITIKEDGIIEVYQDSKKLEALFHYPKTFVLLKEAGEVLIKIDNINYYVIYKKDEIIL